MRKKITNEDIERFLNGHDPQERIVNFDYKGDNSFITVIYRDENDNKCSTTEPFFPFLWATRNACDILKEKNGTSLQALMRKYGIWVKKLDVTNNDGDVVEEILDGYIFMFYATKPISYYRFLDFFKKAGYPVYPDRRKKEGENKPDSPKRGTRDYLVVPPVEQYMISTGKRMFKGYDDYDDTLRMIFDLETTGLNTETDRLEQFGIRFNRPVKYKGEYMEFSRTYHVEGETEEEKNMSELKNIRRMLSIIYTFRPDVITAHNGENFDWNIIIGACKRLGTSIEEISAKYFNGESITKSSRDTILKLGGEIETFRQTIVPRTIITDSLHAVRRAQALDSNMASSGLKYVTKYSNIVKPDRVYIPGDKISEIWNDTSHRFMFCEEDGDWYIYDPSYIPKDEEPDPSITVGYFQSLKDSGFALASASTMSLARDTSATAEEMYAEYIKTIEERNRERLTRKGKDSEPFRLYTKNFIMDGYHEVSGQYIAERYLLDDLWECDKVEHRYNGANFLICKMLPVPFSKCCTMGTASQWKSLIMAWSYENDLAIPMFKERKTFTGGLSRLLKVGYIPNVVKFDYNSLYPSIVLTWAIQTTKDLMGSMLAFLEHVLTQREKFKKLKKVHGKEKEKYKEELKNCPDANQRKELQKKITAESEAESANDKKQLPLKILGNSFFGSYGAPNVFPWGDIDCAERTTCTGRQALRLMISHFSNIGDKYPDMINGDNPEDYNYTPIVGDSFTPDTPLFIKYDNGMIDIVPVENLINEKEIKTDALGREYDYSEKSFSVLCRSGWMKPSYIYRHRCEKDIYEVSNGVMRVEITEDHSLFNSNKEKIKPSQINETTELEYYRGPVLMNEGSCDIPLDIAERWGKELGIGLGFSVPIEILNSNKEIMKVFYYSFMKYANPRKEFSKTCLAGLQYIRRCILLND